MQVIKYHFYTGCPGTNLPYFWRKFPTLIFVDITRQIYIGSLTVPEITTRDVLNNEIRSSCNFNALFNI
jgi:hypothetical protein